MILKKCNVCKEDKPLTEMIKNKDGYRHLCKQCKRKYYHDNKENYAIF